MVKMVLSMTNQVNLRSRFSSFLKENHIPFEQKYVWKEIYCGFKQIVSVQYIVDSIYMDTIRLQAAADTTRGISYKEKTI